MKFLFVLTLIADFSTELATTLFNASLKISLLLIIACLTSFLLGKASAATKHLLWSLSLIGSLVIFFLSSTYIFTDKFTASKAIFQIEAAGQINSADPVLLSAVNLDKKMLPTAIGDPAQETLPYWALLILGIWLLGVVGCLTQLIVGFWGTRRIARRAIQVNDRSLINLSEELCNELHLSKSVTLLLVDKPIIPITWGWLEAVIILPRQFNSWTVEQQRSTLLHELAHVKRGDYLIQMLALIACAVSWFNPLVWFAFRQLRKEREIACDDHVLAAGIKASDYASHLLEISQSQLTARWSSVATVAMANGSEVENRLLAVLHPSLRRRVRINSATVLLWIVMATVTAAFGVLRPVEAQQDGTESLIVALKDKNPQIRESAARTLGLIGNNRQAVMPLVAALIDEEPQVREWAARSLGFRKADDAVSSLILSLKDEDSQVREASAWALGKIGNQSAEAALLAALQDEDDQVREHALRALEAVRKP